MIALVAILTTLCWGAIPYDARAAVPLAAARPAAPAAEICVNALGIQIPCPPTSTPAPQATSTPVAPATSTPIPSVATNTPNLPVQACAGGLVAVGNQCDTATPVASSVLSCAAGLVAVGSQCVAPTSTLVPGGSNPQSTNTPNLPVQACAGGLVAVGNQCDTSTPVVGSVLSCAAGLVAVGGQCVAPTSTPAAGGSNPPATNTPNLPVQACVGGLVAVGNQCVAPTNTPVPALTNTPVPVATNTSVPNTGGGPTYTPVPVATNTSVPVATNTPVPNRSGGSGSGGGGNSTAALPPPIGTVVSTDPGTGQPAKGANNGSGGSGAGSLVAIGAPASSQVATAPAKGSAPVSDNTGATSKACGDTLILHISERAVANGQTEVVTITSRPNANFAYALTYGAAGASFGPTGNVHTDGKGHATAKLKLNVKLGKTVPLPGAIAVWATDPKISASAMAHFSIFADPQLLVTAYLGQKNGTVVAVVSTKAGMKAQVSATVAVLRPAAASVLGMGTVDATHPSVIVLPLGKLKGSITASLTVTVRTADGVSDSRVLSLAGKI